jgi:hypothetical protein
VGGRGAGLGSAPEEPTCSPSWPGRSPRGPRRTGSPLAGGEPVVHAGPIRRAPGLHQRVIAFLSRDGWRRRTPAPRLQSTGQVVRRGAHATRDQPHRPKAPERPPRGVTAGLEDAWLEDRPPTRPRLPAQAGRAARNRACLPAGALARVCVEGSSPRADSHPPHTQSAGHGSVGERTGLEPPASGQAACVEVTTGERSWAPDPGCPWSTTVGETQ